MGIATLLIVIIVWYSYSSEQTRQKGFEFGNKLSQIQEKVKQLQINFNSKITQWEEGDLTIHELSNHADSHLENLSIIVESYDTLEPPPQFSASVDLFRLSTISQLESDRYYIEWIKTNTNSHKIRSDSLLQESFDFELLALGEFNMAKLGYTEYDDLPEQFQAPDKNMLNTINKIWENMREKCHLESQDAESCLNQADKWKADHTP